MPITYCERAGVEGVPHRPVPFWPFRSFDATSWRDAYAACDCGASPARGKLLPLGFSAAPELRQLGAR
jgi:hypothetical protein